MNGVMGVSKEFQRSLAEGKRVAYSGVSGAFANMAAEEIFEGCSAVPCSSFTTAYEAVKNGECESAVLPIENSFAGDVGAVMDLAYFGGLHISGVYEFDITQNLIAVPGTKLEDIKEVVSHPQALSQSGKYIKEHSFKVTEAENTAVAAKMVFESKRKDFAAVGSSKAAELYGLSVVEGHINDSGKNTTRFAVFTREAKEIAAADDHFIMVFTVNNKTGSLCGALSIIGESGFNLVSLKSRPTKDLIWDNYFFVEGEGNRGTEEGKKMLSSLGKYCNTFEVLGSFKRKNLSR